MKKRYLLIVILMFIITNSVLSQRNTADKILTDSLINEWNTRFDSDDPNKISQIITDNVVLISGNDRDVSKDSVMENFVKLRMPVISVLKAVNEFYSVSKEMVFTAGKYTLKVTTSNKETYTAIGNYSFVWTRQNDNQYRITYMHIESVARQ